MTELREGQRSGEIARCRWCARPLPARSGAGRPRRYCRDACRQSAYIARKIASAHGLGANDVIVDRDRLEELQGLVYCLQAAVEDVERDLAEGEEPADVFPWLYENAKPLRSVWIEPRTADL